MYFDAANDRVESDHRLRVEEFRAGHIFARDQKAYSKWARARTTTKPGLVGAALEAAVMNIASLFPQNVIRGTL